MNQYGLIGHPVEHSLSPLIHSEFAEQLYQKMTYEKFDVEPEKFIPSLYGFQAQGIKGLNITLPFKIKAFELSTKLSDSAKECGAVNTLLFLENQEIYGDNTDGAGLIQDLMHNHHYSLRGKKILIIGAGGAAHEIIPALAKQLPDCITLTNRHVEKAQILAEKFILKGAISAVELQKLSTPYDLIINASSAGITGPFPDLSGDLIHTGTWCYDLVYNPKFASFLDWAKKFKPEKGLDGIGMLVEQAALAFYLWRGVAPNTQPIIKKLSSR